MRRPLWFASKNGRPVLRPISWQGWAVLGVFAALAIVDFLRIDTDQNSFGTTLANWLPDMVVLIIVLFVIATLTSGKGRKVAPEEGRDDEE